MEGERIWNDLGRERKNNRIHLNLNLKIVLNKENFCTRALTSRVPVLPAGGLEACRQAC